MGGVILGSARNARRAGLAVAVLLGALLAGVSCVAIGEGSAQARPGSSAAAASARATSGVGVPSLTVAQLGANLSAAALITDAPADITPPLQNNGSWDTAILANGCQLSPMHEVKSKPCIYGDTNAQTSVALFGDSHAGSWFPALEQISKQMHWRLLIFTKAGCTPPVVRLYRKCDTWRKNTEAQIAAIHPAIVFVSWARWLEAKAKPEPGVPAGYGSPWEDGVAAIFRFLAHAAGRVIFISDVPTFNFGAAQCVASHLTDVRPCNDTPRKTAVVLPQVKAEELQLAARLHIAAIDPIPWFCTSTVCPVLVGNYLVYYDNAHMTPAWSRFLTPVLASSIASILG